MKTTKRALFSSVMALILCFSMLVGTTFAWFTDEVKSGTNQIVAGNLDVELEYKTVEDGVLATEWNTVQDATAIFDPNALWEPGRVEVVYLKVSNLGTLALKYRMGVLFDETPGVNMAGEDLYLSEHLVFQVVELDAEPTAAYTREQAVAAAGDVKGIADYNGATTELKAGEFDYVALIVYMPENVGNEANYRGEAIPTITLGIDLFATQVAAEEDSFGKDYDASAQPYIVCSADELATALTGDEENISVILGNDIDLPISSLGTITGGSGEYKLGGENTKAINIDLNGRKLNITTTYWSNLGAKNNDAVITFANGTMTSSQPTGTWNSYDLTFSNCNYVFENVTFEKAIALESSAVLKNVTINETHDYYAMWITAKGQTVTIDGLTINSNGRGIKIDEQYVDAPAKVTLNVSNATFNTVKKAAIMVKSAAGAEINLSKVDTANTPDPVHAVWVDEDSQASYGLVTVNGGKKFYEGDVVSSPTGLNDALAKGETDIVLGAGTYTTNFSIPAGKEFEIIGAGADTVLQGQIATTSSTAGTIILKNLTINVDENIVDSTGISQTGKSAIAIWGNQTVICENVTFNMTLANSTAITSWWDTGVGTTIIVRNCTFNCNGQRPIRATGNVTVENCTFNDPYRYAVQLTAKASTATELEKAIINFNNNTIVNGENGKAFVYGIQLEGADYGCNNCVINGAGNTIVNGGTESTMYYCECGKVDHATITFNTEVAPVHEVNP